MAFLKNLIKICLFSFLIVGAFEANAADKCEKVDKQKYLKVGDFDAAPGERIIYFKKLRDDLKLALQTGEADQATCLYGLYDKAAQDEAGFWQAKAAAEGCDIQNPSECPDPETPRSIKFLENMHTQLENSLKADVAKLEKTEADGECTEGCDKAVDPEADDKAALAELQGALCCGTKEAKPPEDLGVVRDRYPGISYNQCLQKTDKKYKESGWETAGSCLKGIVTSTIKGMLDGVVGFFSLPGELWAARSQIWSIMTDSEYRSQFMEHIKNAFLEFIGVQSGDLTNCLNDSARTTYYCENAGEVIGLLASPALIGNIFKIAKLGVKAAAQAMKLALKSTAKGAKILSKLATVTKKTTQVVARGQKYVRGKAATAALVIGITAKTSKVAQMIIKAGSPFARGARNVNKILSPVVRTGGRIIALPAKVTDKAIVAGFNAGKKVVLRATGKGTQVITATAVAEGTGVAVAASGDAAAAAAAKTTGRVATTAHGAPLEPVVPTGTSMSGKPTTITVKPTTAKPRTGGADVAYPGTKTTPTPKPKVTAQPEVQAPAGTQLELDFTGGKGTAGAGASANPYLGKPASSLQSSLTRTNTELAKVQSEIAGGTPTAAQRAKLDQLTARRDQIENAWTASQPTPPPAGTQLELNFGSVDPAINGYVGRSAGSLRSSLSQTNRELTKLADDIKLNPADKTLQYRRDQLLERKDQILQAQRVPKPTPVAQPNPNGGGAAAPAANPYGGRSKSMLRSNLAAIVLQIQNAEEQMKLHPNERALEVKHQELLNEKKTVEDLIAAPEVLPADSSAIDDAPLAPPGQ